MWNEQNLGKTSFRTAGWKRLLHLPDQVALPEIEPETAHNKGESVSQYTIRDHKIDFRYREVNPGPPGETHVS